ncbi:histone-fold-containing protein [Dacryopinax primogenitus]|uniref:Histone-fold-containing protein n=1 Tax=Dacryopinax primogenitus (strain DJM 731) TaxID=1858805 RepID=M5FPR1_DACPD|nr:histone-fold-containing protein [Dacryopinax primogenitus]EJT97253.1 histone-fold-containing protein [Dacryopinax primogenitus]
MSTAPQLPPQLEAWLREFWQRQMDQAENMREDGLKETTLPLARIKKVMKMDPDVKMISSDAPLLLSKACEIFISEVTSRAWMLAELNKRRTLQRVDVAGAVGQSDQFDFLIDIVPPEYGYSKHKAKREVNPLFPYFRQ